MSKLLIAEPPLQVLPSLACSVGLNEAIILQQMHYWHVKNYPWIKNSISQWRDQFPFWSERTIKRALADMETAGLIQAQAKNPNPFDRVKSYRVNYDHLETIESANMAPSQSANMAPAEGQNGTLSIVRDYNTETKKDAPAAAGRKVKSEIPNLSPHKRIMDLCSYLSEQLRGEKPIIDGKEGAQLKRLLSLRTPEEIEAKAHALADKIRTGTTDFWTGASVLPSVIASRWNSLDSKMPPREFAVRVDKAERVDPKDLDDDVFEPRGGVR